MVEKKYNEFLRTRVGNPRLEGLMSFSLSYLLGFPGLIASHVALSLELALRDSYKWRR